MSMDTTAYNPVCETTKNSKIYDKVKITIRGSNLFHDDEHTVVLIHKMEETGLHIQKI